MRLLAAVSLVGAAMAWAEVPEKPTYLRDIAPILNKAGCTSGPCHGSAKGKNGFKLSLRGYDAQFDYEALLYDLSGRRFNRAEPAKSLMLAKPTQEVAHGGGLRFDANSDYFRTIYRWIEQGVPFGDEAKDTVQAVEVTPKDIFMAKPGEQVSVKVTARYVDGAVRDVSRDATVESSVPDVAGVDAAGAVKGERIGEATLLVRFMGKLNTIPVTVLNPAPGFAWKALPQHNFIDQAIDAKLQKLKIQPSPVVDDAGFLRRVSLDLTGQIPTADQVRAFVADATPARVKRAKLIDRLIGSPAFVDHWTVKWGDLLQSSRKYLGDKGVYAFREYIRESLAANKPYDKWAHEMLTSRGSVYDEPAANFYRVTRDAKPTMEKTTQVFLGVRMVCAQCHDHPFERWTQNQYYQMSAFFSAVGLRAGYEVGEEILFDQRADYELKHPKDGRVVKPQFLIASTGKPVAIPDDARRRDALADWLASKENPFFARAITNRVWSYFFGKGIIDPVDDIRASNPPSNPALLDALTRDFVEHGFDLQHLMRTIANSRAYQTSIVTNEWNAKDELNFSHALPRRLTAEQLMDGVALATGSRPVFPEVPQDTSAAQFPDPHVGKEGFLDVFGRPQRESSLESERRSDFSLPQALNLVNGKTISDAVADPKGRVAKIILAGKSDAAIVEDLYLAALSRLPEKDEAERGVKYLSAGSRAMRAQDLLWALLNSKGFLYIH